MKKNIVLNNLRYLIAFFVIGLSQFAQNINNQFIILLLIIFVGIITLFINEKDAFLFSLVFIAPNRLLTYGAISAPMFILLVSFIKGFLTKKIRYFDVRFIFYSFTLLMLSIITVVNGNSQILSSIKIIIVLLSLLYNVDVSDLKIFSDQLISSLSLGCIFSAFFALLFNKDAINEGGRFELTSSGGNVLGILCACLIVAIMVGIFNNKRLNKLHLIYAVLLFVIGFITGSRTFIVGLCLSIILFVLYYSFSLSRKAFCKLLFGASCLLLALLFCILFVPFIRESLYAFIYRFNSLLEKDISNGRFDLCESYVNVFKDNKSILLFGGLNQSDFGIELVAHNMIIEDIASYGIIGTFVLVLMYLRVFKLLSHRLGLKKIKFDSLIPLFCLLFMGMFSHTLLGLTQTVLLYLSLIIIITMSKKKENKNEGLMGHCTIATNCL